MTAFEGVGWVVGDNQAVARAEAGGVDRGIAGAVARVLGAPERWVLAKEAALVAQLCTVLVDREAPLLDSLVDRSPTNRRNRQERHRAGGECRVDELVGAGSVRQGTWIGGRNVLEEPVGGAVGDVLLPVEAGDRVAAPAPERVAHFSDAGVVSEVHAVDARIDRLAVCVGVDGHGHLGRRWRRFVVFDELEMIEIDGGLVGAGVILEDDPVEGADVEARVTKVQLAHLPGPGRCGVEDETTDRARTALEVETEQLSPGRAAVDPEAHPRPVGRIERGLGVEVEARPAVGFERDREASDSHRRPVGEIDGCPAPVLEAGREGVVVDDPVLGARRYGQAERGDEEAES